MNVYAILSNDNVTKLSTMLESITGLTPTIEPTRKKIQDLPR